MRYNIHVCCRALKTTEGIFWMGKPPREISTWSPLVEVNSPWVIPASLVSLCVSRCRQLRSVTRAKFRYSVLLWRNLCQLMNRPTSWWIVLTLDQVLCPLSYQFVSCLTRKLCYRKDDRAMRHIAALKILHIRPRPVVSEIFNGLLLGLSLRMQIADAGRQRAHWP